MQPMAVLLSGSVPVQNQHLADLRRKDALQHERLTGMYTLLYGAIAGGAAESAVYPLIVVQRRMQLATIHAGRAGGAAAAKEGGLALMRSAAVALYREHGLRGFYIGYLPNILQVWRGSGCEQQSARLLWSWPSRPSRLVMCEVPVFYPSLDRLPDSFADCLIGSPISSQSDASLLVMCMRHVQVLPNAALSYYAYETFKAVMKVD